MTAENREIPFLQCHGEFIPNSCHFVVMTMQKHYQDGTPTRFFLKQDNIEVEASSWALFLNHETKLL